MMADGFFLWQKNLAACTVANSFRKRNYGKTYEVFKINYVALLKHAGGGGGGRDWNF